ncbi:unnamed protein product, partial [marine sediment metagenome]
IIAATTNKEDDAIEEFGRKYSFKVYRGSENDIADRFYQAAKINKADVIIRVWGDCPFVDPELIDNLLKKGIGTDVAKAVVKYAFEKLNLHKVYLGVNAEDERANKCYKKAGFIHEGTHRDYIFRNGRYYHANLYSILEEEFKRTKQELLDVDG